MPLHAGIVDIALALPLHRVGRGKLSVATGAFDEDTLTLAADAALALLDRTPSKPAALVLASISAPLGEGGAVQTLAELIGVAGVGLHVQEHGGTMAAAGSALVGAAALVNAGLAPVLVVASDTRRDASGRPYGDGAAAILLDTDGPVGELVHVGGAAEAFPDRWRRAGQPVVQVGDDSLLPFGPASTHTDALLGHASPVSLITVNTPPRDRAGLLGCAALPAALLLDCDEKQPMALVVSAGGVTHALRFEPGPGLAAASSAARAVLAAGVDAAPASAAGMVGFDPYTSWPRAWRDRRQDLGLEGARCAECERVFYPVPPVCPRDGPDGKLEPWRLARSGTVLTCTRDHLFPLGAPMTMCVVDVDGGGRFYGQAAGAATVRIGDRVRLVPRLLHEGGGRPQYFWKVRPEGDQACP